MLKPGLVWVLRDGKPVKVRVMTGLSDGTNIEVKALQIYTVGRQRGVALLEPAREGLGLTAEEGDRRFEEYFLGPRKGARRDGEG